MAGRRPLLLVLVALALLRPLNWVAPLARRRLGLLALLPTSVSAEEIPPGSIPTDLKATAVGEKVKTPNGVIYEPLDLGTEEQGPRNGPPRGGANVIIRFTAHLESFDGPIFDSSKLRGQRKPNKVDYAESRLNVDPSLPNCVFEAVKLMKVGAKGRAVCPPNLSYGDGKVAFEGDENAEATKVPAGATLYYDLELFIGESVALGFVPSATATVRADERMLTFAINNTAFRELVDEFPEEKQRLLDLVQKRQEVVAVTAMQRIPDDVVTPEEDVAESIPQRPAKRLPGYRSGLNWVRQRRAALEDAVYVKMERTLRSGKLERSAPSLAPAAGLPGPEVGPGTAWKSGAQAVPPSVMRFLKSQRVYGRYQQGRFSTTT